MIGQLQPVAFQILLQEAILFQKSVEMQLTVYSAMRLLQQINRYICCEI